jgi:hypothetical protein
MQGEGKRWEEAHTATGEARRARELLLVRIDVHDVRPVVRRSIDGSYGGRSHQSSIRGESADSSIVSRSGSHTNDRRGLGCMPECCSSRASRGQLVARARAPLHGAPMFMVDVAGCQGVLCWWRARTGGLSQGHRSGVGRLASPGTADQGQQGHQRLAWLQLRRRHR